MASATGTQKFLEHGPLKFARTRPTMHIPDAEVHDDAGANVNPPVSFTAELTGCSVFCASRGSTPIAP
ncbi:hypothetical protein [Polyangium fumosum]|uniref:Uncharacterized protein n=1 Tax=Polyangium fumosum TaxID=889272 RepID=A0A4U1JHM7_9BACT|nr:hypothetical protein [Polyangium fumosum]TKD09988.1 hypothetical protein E8A74_10300 [Polyangium fumosum]